MSLGLLVLLGLWLVTVGAALLVARNRLTRGDTTLRDELLARGVALVAASVALSGFGLAAALLTRTGMVMALVPGAWVLSVLPLFIPPLRRRTGGVLVSSETWVLVSVLITVGGGLFMALFILVRLLLTGPELV